MPITFNGSGTVTGISAGGLPDGCLTAAELATGVGGKILQVKTVEKTGAYTNGSAGTHDVTGFSVTMDAPASSSSKVLILASIHHASQAAINTARFNIVRGSTTIAQPTSGGGNNATQNIYLNTISMITTPIHFLDSPSTTSSTTYKIQIGFDAPGANTPHYINRYHGADTYYTISTLTLMEVAG